MSQLLKKYALLAACAVLALCFITRPAQAQMVDAGWHRRASAVWLLVDRQLHEHKRQHPLSAGSDRTRLPRIPKCGLRQSPERST